ncbi:MAG: DAK2 domain-containing protein, partial [Lachnospiraceae bacterium]
EKLASQTLEKEVGFIAVSLGTGLNSIFKELGVDYIIEGGQTMNPSTEDVLNAIDKVNAKTIFLFPNNKNIILAANQAKDLTNNKNIIVIPTKTIPQGITAIINFMPEKDVKSNEITMISEIQNVKTGQVTYAVRDTTIDGKVIHQGDIMGIGDTGILSIGKSIDKATMKLLSHLVNAQSELISIYYGDGISETDAKRLSEEIESLYPEVDVDMHFGGQPIYYYVLAVE